MIEAFAAPLGGFLYRVRGGVTAWLPILGDTIPRVAFALGAGAVSLLHHDWQLAIAVAVLTFVAEIIPNWSAEDLATTAKKFIIAGTGLMRALLMTVPFFWFGDIQTADFLLVAGLAAGISVTGWKYLNDAYHNPDGTPKAGHTIGWPLQFIKIGDGYLIDGYWPAGEFTFGAFTYLALSL